MSRHTIDISLELDNIARSKDCERTELEVQHASVDVNTGVLVIDVVEEL